MRTTPAYAKPYKLALIRNHEWGGVFTGEIMSYPTPEKTIMVRTVPTFPGTLIEVPLADLVQESHEKYLHLALVAGSGSFPTDMLRYDSAVPVNFKIETEDHRTKIVMDEGNWDGLIVASCHTSRMFPFTTGRWSSFMWGCSSYRPPCLISEAR